MNTVQQVVILSAERSENTFEGNRQRTETLKAILQDINVEFSEATGVFENGPEEQTIVAIIKDDAELEAIKDFAFKSFNQDAILHQDANQEAYLISNKGETTRLGRLQQVSKEVALSTGNYTLMKGVYYTTIKR